MKTLNECVDQVYVINLDRRKDRLEKVIAEMEKYGIKFQRYPAVDGSLLQDEKTDRFNIGCTLSHKNVIQDALNKGYEKICVFEDDVQLNVRFNKEFYPAFQELPENWDLFYLGANNLIPPTPVTKRIHRIYNSLTLHAYLVNSRVFVKLIDLLEKVKNNEPGDSAVRIIQKENNSYIINPRLAYQKQGFSDIRLGFRNYDKVLKNN
jgi:GR25 family glycosyltransferase involved in LPS biosynthesis